MLKVMFIEEVENELQKVAEADHAFNVPDKRDFVMINNTMYVVTERMFDYDNGYVDCLVVKNENIKRNNTPNVDENANEEEQIVNFKMHNRRSEACGYALKSVFQWVEGSIYE